MWTYLQTGKLLTPDGDPAAHQWYSGFGEHANKPEDEGLKGLGPIPCGIYFMASLIRDTKLGPVAIHLLPSEETRRHILELGRDPDSFYVHDDTAIHNHSASEGCIVSVEGSWPVLNLWHSGNRQILVIPGREEDKKVLKS